MAESTGSRTGTPERSSKSSDERNSSTNPTDNIAKYCCFLNHKGWRHAREQGSGFIVAFRGLSSCDRNSLLALNWEKRGKTGEIQTDYALITSHDTIPGLSLTDLKDWTISCQGIESGTEQTLSDLVCGVVSCCGPESIFCPGNSDVKIFREHRNANCQIQLNITILFLNESIEKLLQGVPPVVSVQKISNQEAYTQNCSGSSTLDVYYCHRSKSFPKSAAVSVVMHQDTSEDEQGLSHKIGVFERFQKFYYCNKLGKATLDRKCHGSPLVYHKSTTMEHSIIGVHVGGTGKKGEYFAVTLHGITQLFQGKICTFNLIML